MWFYLINVWIDNFFVLDDWLIDKVIVKKYLKVKVKV